ncbi:alpha/beta fold hydrolase [Aquicoccus sp. SCR17]|nr:alpha/beta fold hydrolase [Carideicomes alvinocaridis]
MIYRFADCLLDQSRHEFRRDGEVVHLEPQVFALLVLLAEARGDLVTRDRMMEVVWGGRIVSEATVAARISAARHAVGDDGQRQAVIRTVTRRGLRLVPPVEVAEPSAPSSASAAASTDALAGDPSGVGPRDSSQPTSQATSRQVIRMTASADGTGIAWAASGEGPSLLRAGHWLSHLQLDWHSPVWRPLLERLGRRHRLIRYDQRGTGLSDRACGPITLDSCAADMRAVADAAGLDRFAIFAVSQSVPVAVAFAARHPDRVRALVLHGGFVRGSLLRDGDEGQRMTETFLDLIRSGWGRPDSAFMTAFSTLFMPEATREQVDSLIEMQLQSASPERAVELRRAIGAFDVSDLLDRVACPVLVSHARGDAVQPFEEGRRLAQGIPDARFAAFDSRNHIMVPQEPGWTGMLEAVDAFLGETLG